MDELTKDVMFSSATNEWATPIPFYKMLDRLFGPFTLDPCCTAATAKCAKFYTEADNGLSYSWEGETAFVNPPYGRDIPAWVEHCFKMGCLPNTRAVMLIPARPDTAIFHKFCMRAKAVYFVKGRLTFWNPKLGAPAPAPFPSMVVDFKDCVDLKPPAPYPANTNQRAPHSPPALMRTLAKPNGCDDWSGYEPPPVEEGFGIQDLFLG